MSAYWKNSALAALAATVIIGVQFCAADAFAETGAPIGKTIAAATLVNAYGKNGVRVIAPKSPIYSDDRLQANANGNAQIILVDKTRIVVGPGAEVRIDEFVFDTNKTFSKIVVKVSKGAIRFISGKSKSSAYKIKTPSGTIGIRG